MDQECLWGSSGDASEFFPGATEGSVAYGWAGGLKSANELLALYLYSLGAIPLVFSILGALAGYVLCSFLSRRLADDSTTDPRATTAGVSVIRSILVYAAVAYVTDVVANGRTFSSLGPMGWAGQSLALLQVLNIAIWGTITIAAYLRYQRWQIAAGVIGIGASLYLLRAYSIFPPSGWMLGAVLLLVYIAATNRGWSSMTTGMALTREDERPQAADFKSDGAGELVVFLLGGSIYYAVVCLFTLLAVMTNRNLDNWGIVTPIFIGIWGIPIFVMLAASIHTWAGPWAWLSKRRAWLSSTCAFSICILLWVAVLSQ